MVSFILTKISMSTCHPILKKYCIFFSNHSSRKFTSPLDAFGQQFLKFENSPKFRGSVSTIEALCSPMVVRTSQMKLINGISQSQWNGGTSSTAHRSRAAFSNNQVAPVTVEQMCVITHAATRLAATGYFVRDDDDGGDRDFPFRDWRNRRWRIGGGTGQTGNWLRPAVTQKNLGQLGKTR